MSRTSDSGELEPIVRYQAIDFPESGPRTATTEQMTGLAKALEDAVAQEARYGQVVPITRHDGRHRRRRISQQARQA